MSAYYEDEPQEHECPTALERRVDEMAAGGLVFTPAGRFETIVDSTRRAVQVTLTTDRAVWMFWPSDKLPYLGGWMINGPRHVVVNEGHSHLELVVAGRPGWGASRGHVLASAQQIRGTGWQIQDRPTGAGDVEYVTVDSKAKARAEMNRRARAHGKRLGLTVWRDGGAR